MMFLDLLPAAMFATLVVLLFSGYPVAFVLGGVALFYALVGMAFGLFVPVELFNIVARIYGGVVQSYILVAIPMFIFMGTLLGSSGVGNELLQVLQRMLRGIPGGLALAVTVLGTIMAATTGIVGASVVMLALLAIPTMLEHGYDHGLATGTIAASGTLGILIPPSIMLVLMADLLSISAGRLFLGAVFPGLALAALYAVYVVTRTWINPKLAPRAARGTESSVSFLEFLRVLFPMVALIVMVLGSIAFGLASTTEAAGVGAFGALIIVLLRGRLSLPVMRQTMTESSRTNAMLFMIFVGATAFSYVFRALGGDFLVEQLVKSSGAGSWSILLVLMGLAFIMGFFFEWIEITLILLPIYIPILSVLDFTPHVAAEDMVIWIAILLAVNLQTSFLTPPFGIALFYMRGITPPEVRIQSIYRGIIPFVLMQLLALGAVMAFPALALWLPHRLLD